MTFYSNSAEETEKIGSLFARSLKGTEVIALYGDMGAGKTTFVRGMAEFFGIKDMVSSPTFSIINEYDCKKFKIYHFDMYRITSWEGLESTGFFDYLGTGVIIVEWSENIEAALPKGFIKVTIQKGNGENERRIEIEGIKINENASC